MRLLKHRYLHYFLLFSTLYPLNDLSISNKLKNIGKPINTSTNEFSPCLAPDGSYMMFNSKKSSPYQDIYISYFDFKKNKWGEPIPVHILNSPYNDETPFISFDGKLLVFSSDRDGSFEKRSNITGKIRVSYDIYYSYNINNRWAVPKKLPGKVNTADHEKAPSLSKDGNFLYYTSWPFGNMKNSSLLKSELKNGIFQKPRMLPKAINSGFQETALVEAENGKGFYFSSQRPGGWGGWDIYFIPFRDSQFGKPVNLGKKVNSEGNDVFISGQGQNFLISSNRKGGEGGFDIYSTYIFQKKDDFETRAIYFDYNSHKLKERSFEYLDALAKFLKKNPTIKLEIIGHTDLHGSDEFNLKLSKKRAASVMKYLVSKGTNKKRLRIKGEGKRKPVIDKIGKEFDILNRRTEFKILK